MTPPCGQAFMCAKVVSLYCLDGEDYWTSPKRILKCLLPHLKTVKIVGFAGDQSGFRLPFIQLLLKNATTLKRMDISIGKWFLYFRKCDITQFPREMQKIAKFSKILSGCSNYVFIVTPISYIFFIYVYV
ncbi:unnamed protein product [Camellia sinensis]